MGLVYVTCDTCPFKRSCERQWPGEQLLISRNLNRHGRLPFLATLLFYHVRGISGKIILVGNFKGNTFSWRIKVSHRGVIMLWFLVTTGSTFFHREIEDLEKSSEESSDDDSSAEQDEEEEIKAPNELLMEVNTENIFHSH